MNAAQIRENPSCCDEGRAEMGKSRSSQLRHVNKDCPTCCDKDARVGIASLINKNEGRTRPEHPPHGNKDSQGDCYAQCNEVVGVVIFLLLVIKMNKSETPAHHKSRCTRWKHLVSL